MDRLQHDNAWKLATTFFEETKHLVFEREWKDLFQFYLEHAERAFKEYEEQAAQMRKRMRPLG